MTRTPPPLSALEIELPAWPAVDRARRRLDTVRSATGHVATAAGAAAAAIGLFTPAVAGGSLLATAALSCAGLVTLRLWKPDGHQKATATVMYLAPGVCLSALLLAEQMVAGIHWGEALALAVWTVGTGLMRPARLARQMLCPPPPPTVDLAPVDDMTDGHPAAQWWAQRVAIEGGAAPDTILECIEQTGVRSMRAVIRSAATGRPVPDVPVKSLSALMDIPEDQITIGPVPSRGASVRLLTIGQPEEEHNPAKIWAQQIAPVAMQGSVLTGVRVGRPGTKESN